MKEERPKFDADGVIHELKEGPLRKFSVAFALMSVIPLLAFFYLFLVRFLSFSVLVGNVGFILFVCIVIALLGFASSYSIISRLLKE